MSFEPIIPFEPILAERIPEGEGWAAQVKWDGVRILSYYDGARLRLFNRKKHERTLQFPELQELPHLMEASSFILDGEVIALGEDGKPSFHQVMRRDHLQAAERIARRMAEVPVYYMVFDLLFLNDRWIIEQPFYRRDELLHRLLHASQKIFPVETYPSQSGVQRMVKSLNLEGVVVKKKESVYLPGGKDGRWLKWKNLRSITGIVGGMVFREGEVRSLLLGRREGKGLRYIGHVGTQSLKIEERLRLGELLLSLCTATSPFLETRGLFRPGTIWLLPHYSVRVRFLEWTAAGTLRQPVIENLGGVEEGKGDE